MQIRVCLAAAALAGLALAPAHGAGPYVSAGAGVNSPTDQEFDDGFFPINEIDSDAGYALIGAIGRDFGGPFRMEIEGGYRQNDGEDVDLFATDVSAGHVVANLLFSPDIGPLSPYAGAGAGFANVSVDVDGLGGDDSGAFAWQVIAGAGFAFTSQVELFADYRFFSTEGLEIEAPAFDTLDEYRAHTVMGGLRFYFGRPGRPSRRGY